MKLEYKVIDNKYINVKEVLKAEFKISDRLLTKLKKNNLIFVNNDIAYVSQKLNIGDIIIADIKFEETSSNIVPMCLNLDILYEDDSMLIINKKSNMPVHPSALHFTDTLSNAVQDYYNKNNIKTLIRPVNRLDKDTSGIVILAKNEYIQEELIKQMKTKEFKKEYIAILEGNLKNKSGTINAPIARKEGSIIEREINFETGEKAITHYTLEKTFIKNNMQLSLVHFILETGRTHQIRVHSKYIGHPILGDTLYGNESSLISRQALHAYKISFIHPKTKKSICIDTNCLPDDIQSILM